MENKKEKKMTMFADQFSDIVIDEKLETKPKQEHNVLDNVKSNVEYTLQNNVYNNVSHNLNKLQFKGYKHTKSKKAISLYLDSAVDLALENIMNKENVSKNELINAIIKDFLGLK